MHMALRPWSKVEQLENNIISVFIFPLQSLFYFTSSIDPSIPSDHQITIIIAPRRRSSFILHSNFSADQVTWRSRKRAPEVDRFVARECSSQSNGRLPRRDWDIHYEVTKKSTALPNCNDDCTGVIWEVRWWQCCMNDLKDCLRWRSHDHEDWSWWRLHERSKFFGDDVTWMISKIACDDDRMIAKIDHDEDHANNRSVRSWWCSWTISSIATMLANDQFDRDNAHEWSVWSWQWLFANDCCFDRDKVISKTGTIILPMIAIKFGVVQWYPHSQHRQGFRESEQTQQ
jgi:hypothetical protein